MTKRYNTDASLIHPSIYFNGSKSSQPELADHEGVGLTLTVGCISPDPEPHPGGALTAG